MKADYEKIICAIVVALAGIAVAAIFLLVRGMAPITCVLGVVFGLLMVVRLENKYVLAIVLKEVQI